MLLEILVDGPDYRRGRGLDRGEGLVEEYIGCFHYVPGFDSIERLSTSSPNFLQFLRSRGPESLPDPTVDPLPILRIFKCSPNVPYLLFSGAEKALLLPIDV